MKKLLVILAGLILVVGLISCTNYLKSFYGTYKFEKVSYLSPVSSASVDSLNENMMGTEYLIEADMFTVRFDNAKVEVASPIYKKEALPNLDEMVDAACVIGNEIEYQYTILNDDGSYTGWRVYVSKDTLWVSSYVDNTADGSEIILNIFKIS